MAHKSEETPVKPLPEKPIKQLDPSIPSKNPCSYKSTGLILIAVIAMIMSLWALITNFNLQNNLEKQKVALLNEVKASQNTDQNQQVAQIPLLLKNQEQLENKVEDLNQQLQVSLKETLYQNQDWLLLKARYYLELAQINAHWSDNYEVASALLEQADKLIAPIKSKPQLLSLRQAIAKEIAQLKAIPTVDTVGLLSQLDAAEEQVAQLTLQMPEVAASKAIDSASSWKESFQNNLHLLKDMVRIRRDNQSIEPLISPLYESVLRESIYLNLQQAQWAILNNNQIIYDMSIKKAIEQLSQSFDVHSKIAESLLKQLQSLQKVKITREKLQINTSLPLINEIIDSVPKEINSEKGDHN